MVCIYCSGQTQVINSRHQKRLNSVWRRRKCTNCEAIFSTIEQADAARALRVSSHNGLEPFSREKLLISLYDSLRHRKTAIEDATALIGTIESLILPHVSSAAINRDTIIEITAGVLKRFDRVAATHYEAFHPPKG